MAVEAKLDELAKVLSRLETSLARIESKLGSGSVSGNDTPSGSEKPFVGEWDNLVIRTAQQYIEVSKKIGGDAEKHVRYTFSTIHFAYFYKALLVQKALEKTREFLVHASKNKKPDNTQLPKLLEPLSKAITEVKEFKDKNSKATKQPNHLSTIDEGIAAFGWVAEGLPAPFIETMRGSSEFWSNKILKDFKGKDETQVQWVQHWNSFLKELQAYVKQYHTTGVAWA